MARARPPGKSRKTPAPSMRNRARRACAASAPIRPFRATRRVRPASSHFLNVRSAYANALSPKKVAPHPSGERCDHGISHLAGADFAGSLLKNIRGAIPLGEYFLHRDLDAGSDSVLIEAVAKH